MELCHCENDGTRVISSFGKKEMSASWTAENVNDLIRETLSIESNMEIEDGYIQLYLTNGERLKPDQNVLLRDLITPENDIKFEVLPFKMEELEGNVIVKAIHYTVKNEVGKTYTKLVPENTSVWLTIK